MDAALLTLRSAIESRQARLAVIGLGYVGLPVACEFAKAGFDVLGIDVQPGRVQAVNAGRLPIEGDEPGLQDLLVEVQSSGRLRATREYAELAGCQVILICVETPVDENHHPQYTALRSVLHSLNGVLPAGALVVVESTLAPTTMDCLVQPLLESSGRKAGRDFFLGICPERVMPGRLLANLRSMSRVVGGQTPETAQVMLDLYRNIVQADLDPSDCITAELVKTTENAYRDVQIAFANEVALICEQVGADVWQVRQLVNKSPFRQMHLPGAGVGGHCILKDPWLLVHPLHELPDGAQLIPAARRVNDGMPGHVAGLLQQTLREDGWPIQPEHPLHGVRVLVMGYAYLENSGDDRNSPSAVLVRRLGDLGAECRIHDPYVPGYQGDLFALAQDCDAAVLMVRHAAYGSLDLAELRRALRRAVLVDGRALYTPEAARRAGLRYRCLGVGDHHLP